MATRWGPTDLSEAAADRITDQWLDVFRRTGSMHFVQRASTHDWYHRAFDSVEDAQAFIDTDEFTDLTIVSVNSLEELEALQSKPDPSRMN